MGHSNRLQVVRLNYTPVLLLVVVVFFVLSASCGGRQRQVIAVIPRTTGIMLWEAEHAGALAAAEKYGFSIYWNAPTREDDFEQQIALVERIGRERLGGLVLAPSQALALMTPVRRAVSAGVPTVIVSSPLHLASGKAITSFLNDDEACGRIAALRIGTILGGRGTVAVLSPDPSLSGVTMQVRTFGEYLASHFARIDIVDRRLGAYNAAEVQHATEEILNEHPDLGGLIAFTAVATRGAFLALRERDPQAKVKLIGYEQDGDLMDGVAAGRIDALLAEDTYQMGYRAVSAIAAFRSGQRIPPSSLLKPLLITRENVLSPEIRQALNFGWSDVR